MEKWLLEPLHKILCKCFNFIHTKATSTFSSLLDYILFQIHPFWHHLCYCLTVSSLGYLALKATTQNTSTDSDLNDVNLFFTSVSATTISSMSTVQMEEFSSIQLVFILILMLSGGEVFLSLLGLRVREYKHKRRNEITNSKLYIPTSIEVDLKYRSLRRLGHVVWAYLLISHVIGYSLVSLYISIVPSASRVLESKGIEMHLFSLFAVVSTFSNCGFIPTNENMMPFKKNSGLLLILIPPILMGNKIFPCCLRLVLLVLEKLTNHEEFRYMLKNNKDLGYGLLMSGIDALLLGFTAVMLVLWQYVVFCILEWNSMVLEGLNWRQKLVGSLFQTVNSRHSGESIVDLSMVSAATMVLFVVMMYLPSYTAFVPTCLGWQKKASSTSISDKDESKRSGSIMENLKFSHLSYLAIFVMLICITERTSLKNDPLNFNVFNIIVEVVSAYGNVGFSVGYSCERRLDTSDICKDKWYGFVGRWSTEGKLVLILVMLFGRLKRFSFNGGKAWKISL